MENTSNFVFDGGIRLPVGYRFSPTDEELVEHYLKRKVFGLPLPASVIPEFNVFLTDPWGLPGNFKFLNSHLETSFQRQTETETEFSHWFQFLEFRKY